MLYKAKTIKGYTLKCLDGELGRAEEFYFDDKLWIIRYLVVDTGNWLVDRHVLISPYAIDAIDKEQQQVNINLTKKKIEDSPSLDSDEPVSRQFEVEYHKHYGWSGYWGGSSLWGSSPTITHEGSKDTGTPDPHLQSTHSVSGYHVQANDCAIGHVEDFIIDEVTWTIRYLIVDTQNWLPGRKVLISPHWIDHISWDESKVFVNLPSDSIMHSPEYSEKSLLTRDYETQLFGHYNRGGYWGDDSINVEQ